MNTQSVSFFSRTGLERAFAGMLFTASVALISSGALSMALRTTIAA